MHGRKHEAGPCLVLQFGACTGLFPMFVGPPHVVAALSVHPILPTLCLLYLDAALRAIDVPSLSQVLGEQLVGLLATDALHLGSTTDLGMPCELAQSAPLMRARTAGELGAARGWPCTNRGVHVCMFMLAEAYAYLQHG